MRADQNRWIVFFLSITFCFVQIACNNSIPKDTLDSQHFYKGIKPVKENELSIQYFGIGSTLISYKGKSVFTDPCFSTPSLQEVAFGRVVTDTALIKLLKPTLQHVKFTLIGHAHYDHLMDLPYLATHHLPKKSTVIGCQTAENLIASANIPQKFVIANVLKGNYETSGKWIFSKDSTIRVMVFAGHHPPQIARIIKFGIGKVKAPLNEIPQLKPVNGKRAKPIPS